MCWLYKVMIDLQIRLLLSHTNIAIGKEKTLGRAAVCPVIHVSLGSRFESSWFVCVFVLWALQRRMLGLFPPLLVRMLPKISRSRRDVSLEAMRKIQKTPELIKTISKWPFQSFIAHGFSFSLLIIENEALVWTESYLKQNRNRNYELVTKNRLELPSLGN